MLLHSYNKWRMAPNDLITLVAAVVFLAIAIIAGFKRGEGPLTRPLGLMALMLFSYCVADVAGRMNGGHVWTPLAYAAASFAGVFAVSVVAGFLGVRHRLRFFAVPLYIYFASLGLYCVVTAALPGRMDEPIWATGMLCGVGISSAVLGYRLWDHARHSPAIERARCRLLGSAFILGFGSVALDLIAMTGTRLPRLAALGLALTAVVLATMVLWSQQLFVRVPHVLGSVAILFALVGVIGQLAIVKLAAGHVGLVAFGAVIVVGFVGVGIWPFFRQLAVRRTRRRYHAALGRWTDQVRHNILNPLGAMKGAAELALHAHEKGKPIRTDDLRLIVSKVDQLARLIRNFERLARGEPNRAPVDLNETLVEVARCHEAATGHPVTLDLDDALLPAMMDRDLLVPAFENLACNARDAMPDGGQLTIRTEVTATPLGRRVVIRFEDEGHGIDPRVLEDIFEPDFSTRPRRGSGPRTLLRARGNCSTRRHSPRDQQTGQLDYDTDRIAPLSRRQSQLRTLNKSQILSTFGAAAKAVNGLT